MAQLLEGIMNRCSLGEKRGVLYSKTGGLGRVLCYCVHTQTTSDNGANGILGRG
jgi:hypothetical protein